MKPTKTQALRASDVVRREPSPTLKSECRKLAESGKPLVWPDVGRNGKPDANSIANVEAFLKWAGVVVVFDEFERRTLVHGIPDMREWDDAAVRTVRMAANEFGLKMTAEFTNEAVLSISGDYRLHPVREYLDQCQKAWDGAPRVDRWLVDYAQAEDTELVRAICAVFLVAAVRRVRKPGCKFDTLLVLEGEQGSGKSSLGKALAGHEDWFGDSLPLGADPKVTIELTAGKWIVEHAELTGISKHEVENVKAFLSRQTDEAREAYGRHKTRVPRQFILIGTTNDDRYLIDGTGNRRFLPVRCMGGAGSIDIKRLQADREQLWGEAAKREAEGASIMLPETLWGEAAAVQESRRLQSSIEITLTDLVEPIPSGFIAHEDVMKAVNMRAGQGEFRHQKQIDETMKRLGWWRPKDALKKGNYRKRGWAKGENWQDDIWTLNAEFDEFLRNGRRARSRDSIDDDDDDDEVDASAF